MDKRMNFHYFIEILDSEENLLLNETLIVFFSLGIYKKYFGFMIYPDYIFKDYRGSHELLRESEREVV